MIVEINIGLNVKGRANSMAEVQQRAERAIEQIKLRYQAAEFRRYSKEYEAPDGICREDGLAVRVDIPPGNSISVRNFLWCLSMDLEQDCVAIYLPEGIVPMGGLVGPKSDAWGAFQLEWFERF